MDSRDKREIILNKFGYITSIYESFRTFVSIFNKNEKLIYLDLKIPRDIYTSFLYGVLVGVRKYLFDTDPRTISLYNVLKEIGEECEAYAGMIKGDKKGFDKFFKYIESQYNECKKNDNSLEINKLGNLINELKRLKEINEKELIKLIENIENDLSNLQKELDELLVQKKRIEKKQKKK